MQQDEEEASWDELRKQARVTENEVDALLAAFSPDSLDHTKGVSVVASNEHLISEIEEKLARLVRATARMKEMQPKLVMSRSSQATLSVTIEHHEDLLQTYQRDCRRKKAKVAAQRQREELLFAQQYPHRSAAVVQLDDGGDAAMAASVQRERDSTRSAHSSMDTVLSQSATVSRQLRVQRERFVAAVDKLESMTRSMPAVSRLIRQVRDKKRRDVFVLAAVVAALLFVTVVWKLL